MKKLASIFSIAVACLAVVVVLTSCLQPARTSRPADEEAEGEDSRNFDPLELPRDREIVPEMHPQNVVIRGSQQFEGGDTTAAGMDSLTARLPEDIEEIDTVYAQAFRVQLLTSKAYGEARQAVRIAEEIFDRPVYLDYEVPYYKLRVGSFRNREDAEVYQQRAKTAGYTNAWVVLVNVNVQEPEPLYRDLPLPEVVDTTKTGDTLDVD